MILIRLDPNRLDYVVHAQELIAWAQELGDNQKELSYLGRNFVAAVTESRKMKRVAQLDNLRKTTQLNSHEEYGFNRQRKSVCSGCGQLD